MLLYYALLLLLVLVGGCMGGWWLVPSFLLSFPLSPFLLLRTLLPAALPFGPLALWAPCLRPLAPCGACLRPLLPAALSLRAFLPAVCPCGASRAPSGTPYRGPLPPPVRGLGAVGWVLA
jgi:hypothetical protein